MSNTEYITAPVYNDGTKATVKWYDAVLQDIMETYLFHEGLM